MEAFREFSRVAIEKFGQGEVLTELEQVIVYEHLRLDELGHAARAWGEDFDAIKSTALLLLPPVENLRGDWMSCWDVDSSREFMCTAMGEVVCGSPSDPQTKEGDGSGHAECQLFDVFTRTTFMSYSGNLTTRSPFGDFFLLKDARVGEVIFVKDDLLDGWTLMRIDRIDEGEGEGGEGGRMHCTTALETSYVTVAEKRMVSRTPPEWGGQRWSLNPFTHEVCIYLDFFGSRIAEKQSTNDVALTQPKEDANREAIGVQVLRTKNHVLARREALRHRNHMPGLWSALTFLQDHPDYVPMVPAVEYTTWMPRGVWTPPYCYTNGKAVPPNSIPSMAYAHGYVTVPALFSDRSLITTGWYAAPDGIRVFAEPVHVAPYKDTIELIELTELTEPPHLEIRLDGLAFQFESEESRTTFLEAYVKNAKDYFSLEVFVSRVHHH